MSVFRLFFFMNFTNGLFLVLGVITGSMSLAVQWNAVFFRKVAISILLSCLGVGICFFLFDFFIKFPISWIMEYFWTLIFGGFLTMYLILFAWICRQEVLVKVNELMLLGLTVFAASLFFVQKTEIWMWILFSWPAYVVLMLGIFPVRLTYGLKIFLYVWYLLLLIIIWLTLGGWQSLVRWFYLEPSYSGYSMQIFLLGGLISLIFINLFQIFWLLPVQYKHETNISFWMRTWENFEIITEKFIPHQYHVGLGLLVMTGVVAGFWLVNLFHGSEVWKYVIFILLSTGSNHMAKIFQPAYTRVSGHGIEILTAHKRLLEPVWVIYGPLFLLIFIGIMYLCWNAEDMMFIFTIPNSIIIK